MLAAMAAAAAVVIVGAGVTLFQGTLAGTPLSSKDLGAAGAPKVPGANTADGYPSARPEAGVPGLFLATGRDYGPATLGQIRSVEPMNGRSAGTVATAPVPSQYSVRSAPQDMSDQVPAALLRLTDAAALDVCLRAVVAAHPGTTELVDYARYNSAPALVVLLRTESGWLAVAVGPNCGLNGPDERAAAGV
jgi:hypothetical protein